MILAVHICQFDYIKMADDTDVNKKRAGNVMNRAISVSIRYNTYVNFTITVIVEFSNRLTL